MRDTFIRWIATALVLGLCSGCFVTDSDDEPLPCLSEGWETAEGTAFVFTTEGGVIETTLTTSAPDTLEFAFTLRLGDNSSIELLMPDAVLVYDPEGLLVIVDEQKAVLMQTDAFGSPCTDDVLAAELDYAGLPTFAFSGTALTRSGEEPAEE